MHSKFKQLLLLLGFCLSLASCGGRQDVQTVDQLAQLHRDPPAQIGGMLPMPSEADDLAASVIIRSSSDIQGSAAGWTPNVFGDGTFSQNGDTLVMETEPQTRVGALYRLVFDDGAVYEKQVPFLYPYELKINTDGLGPLYILLPDYKFNRWRVVDGTTFSGETISIPGGLTGNHGNASGSFVFGIVAWDGSDVRVDSIDLLLPDVPVAGQPLQYHQFVEAADGTLLATDVYLPYIRPPGSFDPPYPAAMIRTPYDKSLVGPVVKPLTDLGIVAIVQYFRGRLNDSGMWPDSGGTESLFRDHAGPDHTDAIDTVDWLEGLYWYDGQLALSGPSALGVWNYQAAPALADRLSAIYPIVSAGNLSDWALFENGALKQGNVEIFLNGNGYPPALLQEVIDNFDDAQYRDVYDFDSRASEVTCSGFHETGWWDVDVDATINSWQALQTNGGVGAAGKQWLVIGPWHHESVRMLNTGELTFPTIAGHDPRFFPVVTPRTWDGAQWVPALLAFGVNLAPTNPVLAYFIGEEGNATTPANSWIELENWPPPGGSSQSLYLTAAGQLAGTAPVSADSIGFTLDPVHPIATLGGANLPDPVWQSGPYDQASLLPNIDILEYRGAVLGSHVTIAGEIIANLFVSTNAVDSDVCIKLIDEYPDGRKMLVGDGIMRLSYAHPEGFNAGETLELNWNICSRAYVFGSGHRIVVHIQGSNAPRFNPNPGNGDAYFNADSPQGAMVQVNVLHIGGSQASYITLPLFDPS